MAEDATKSLRHPMPFPQEIALTQGNPAKGLLQYGVSRDREMRLQRPCPRRNYSNIAAEKSFQAGCLRALNGRWGVCRQAAQGSGNIRRKDCSSGHIT
jgi:hypothetical protein